MQKAHAHRGQQGIVHPAQHGPDEFWTGLGAKSSRAFQFKGSLDQVQNRLRVFDFGRGARVANIFTQKEKLLPGN
jgi:hypothetical protein